MQKNSFPLFAFAAKFGPKLLSLIVKLTKFSKLGLAGASLAGYSMLFTWQFAVVILAAIGFHESGHVWAMKRCGIRTKGFYFIPFLGGAAVAEESFKTRANEAFIGIMGPIWGIALALVAYGVYLLTQNPLFAAITGWMALINLINLLPINPLDGGRITKSIVFSINSTFGVIFLIIGVIAMIYLSIQLRFFIFLILLGAGSLELLDEHKDYLINRVKAKFFPIEQLHGQYKPPMTIGQRFLTFFGYTALISALLWLMNLTSHVPGSAIAMETLIDSHPEKTAETASTGMAWWMIVLLTIFAIVVIIIIYSIIRKFISNIKDARDLETSLREVERITNDFPKLLTSLTQPYDNPHALDFQHTIAHRFVFQVILPLSRNYDSLESIKDYFFYRLEDYQKSQQSAQELIST